MYQIYDTYISIKNRLDLFCHKVFWFQYRFLPTILIFSSEKNIEYKASPNISNVSPEHENYPVDNIKNSEKYWE